MTLLPPPFLPQEQGKWEAQQRAVASGLAGKVPLRESPLAFHFSARSPCQPTESESPAPSPAPPRVPYPSDRYPPKLISASSRTWGNQVSGFRVSKPSLAHTFSTQAFLFCQLEVSKL